MGSQGEPGPRSVPPAGWYPDLERDGQERGWTGTEWTDERRAKEAIPSARAPSDDSRAVTAPVTADTRSQSTQPDWVYQKTTGWLYLALQVVLAFTPVFFLAWGVGIYLAVAVYQDLRRLGRSTTGWVLLVLLFGAIPYLAYVYKRPTGPVHVEQTVQPVASVPAAASSTHPMPPSGWYADPRGEARLRWWDGGAWTEHVAE